MDLKFATAASNSADFNLQIDANAAGAQNGSEICRGRGKFPHLLHASKRLYKR